MEKLQVENQQQNNTKIRKGTQRPLSTKTQVFNTTLLRKVKIKINVKLCNAKFKETQWLFEQYEIKKPGWLRRQFRIDQRRRKCLNDVFYEAGLDSTFCKIRCDSEDWASILHAVWHDVNGTPTC